jgi:hypothetical protein
MGRILYTSEEVEKIRHELLKEKYEALGREYNRAFREGMWPGFWMGLIASVLGFFLLGWVS